MLLDELEVVYGPREPNEDEVSLNVEEEEEPAL